MRQPVMVVAAQFVSACAFSVYPGAERASDTQRTPRRAVAYSTPDAYARVLEYYKRDCKVVEDVPGAAEVQFESGEGIIIRDMKQQGAIIVVLPKRK